MECRGRSKKQIFTPGLFVPSWSSLSAQVSFFLVVGSLCWDNWWDAWLSKEKGWVVGKLRTVLQGTFFNEWV